MSEFMTKEEVAELYARTAESLRAKTPRKDEHEDKTLADALVEYLERKAAEIRTKGGSE